MVITIVNPNVSDNIQTALSDDYTSSTSLSVDSGKGFVNGNYIIVGEPGLEKTEITNLTAAPGSETLTVTALSYNHPKGTPVYYTRWNKYALQYKTSSTGTWTDYSSMPSDLEFDSQSTEYRDSSAKTTYYWKYRYYSTEKTAYSDYSDTIAASGWAKNTVGFMVRNVRKIINDPEAKTVSDTEIIRFINAAQDKIYSLYDRWWFLLKMGTAIDTEESTKIYELPSDFGRLHSILFNYVSGNTDITYNLKYITMVEFDYQSKDNSSSDDDEVKYYTIYPGDSSNESGYFHIWPTPESDGLEMTPRYYKKFTDLDSYADATECPLPSMLEDYALAQIYKIKQKEAEAKYYDTAFREQIELLKFMQRKQVDQLKVLWKYQGRRAKSRLFGSRDVYSDSSKERNW